MTPWWFHSHSIKKYDMSVNIFIVFIQHYRGYMYSPINHEDPKILIPKWNEPAVGSFSGWRSNRRDEFLLIAIEWNLMLCVYRSSYIEHLQSCTNLKSCLLCHLDYIDLQSLVYVAKMRIHRLFRLISCLWAITAFKSVKWGLILCSIFCWGHLVHKGVIFR